MLDVWLVCTRTDYVFVRVLFGSRGWFLHACIVCVQIVLWLAWLSCICTQHVKCGLVHILAFLLAALSALLADGIIFDVIGHGGLA